MLRLLPFIILLGLEIYALIDCLRSDEQHIRNLPKVGWALLIVFIPLIGLVLWFTLGRPRYQAEPPVRKAPMAPDDDPDFLRNLDIARRQKTEEERLRLLRAELEERERKLRDQES
ncbi:PLD nuclease N-terminal domain-containing protein [Psychromicrobium sp. YIM B11713]|uniref:PLD nuclease N-terminal domain-containing protein n=1 Tax=Psychromicrobium sp. YIM B11713 TaxID=3145233 RepID=UPI00374F78FD